MVEYFLFLINHVIYQNLDVALINQHHHPMDETDLGGPIIKTVLGSSSDSPE